VVRRVVFGMENPRRLLLVARAQTFAFARRGIEAEINGAPLAQPNICSSLTPFQLKASPRF
jgi:hypothetical protein